MYVTCNIHYTHLTICNGSEALVGEYGMNPLQLQHPQSESERGGFDSTRGETPHYLLHSFGQLTTVFIPACQIKYKRINKVHIHNTLFIDRGN
jgi:hypothetical protein